MKEELERQVVDQRRAKQEEKRKELEYMEKLRIRAEEEQLKEKAKHD
jgi:hypothetical protein